MPPINNTSTEPVSVAAIMTCHNRKANTLGCLKYLHEQRHNSAVLLDIVVVDAGSTDGTKEAIKELYPDVQCIEKDDSIFWCGGMRLAFEHAMQTGYDHYLWVNDDTELVPCALSILLQTDREILAQTGKHGIVVGSVCDPITKQRTYGGVNQAGGLKRMGFNAVLPDDHPIPCETFNGNCVLIPQQIAQETGNLSREFTHGIGDYDYGLRARKLGYDSWVSPGYVGFCHANQTNDKAFSPEVPLRKRLRILHSPKGLPPREWITFGRRHAGGVWILSIAALYLRVLLPGLWQWKNNLRNIRSERRLKGALQR